MPSHLRHVLIIALCLVCIPVNADEVITLRNDLWKVEVRPASMQVTAYPKGRSKFELSAAQEGLGKAANVECKGSLATFDLQQESISVSMELKQSDLIIHIRSSKDGDFTWPVIRHTPALKGLIWPRWEGCYVPINDAKWDDYLVREEWNTLEGLSMPFWGLDCSDCILTYIITNPYNNRIRFVRENGQLTEIFTHEFTPNNAQKEYGFLIRLSEGASPIEPAKQFRQWLIENGKFVSMQEKAKKAPKVARLLGAPHVYLWGDGLITRHDIYQQQWRPFCKTLAEQGNAVKPSVGKRIKELMTPAQWKNVMTIANAEWPDDYTKGEVASALSGLLERPDFYDKASWEGIALPGDATLLLSRDGSALSASEICRMNSLLLRAASPDAMLEVENCGDGVSMKMLKQFEQAGFDRMELCVDGWSGVEKRPEVVAEADKMGYLFGTYDSYHSIHDPALKGTDATWETAQFDKDLYEKGPIVGRDGRKLAGFKKKGYKLSPIAARPYVEKRVKDIMAKTPFNYYFVDCDAYGEVYDDYSPQHPATQAEDAAARNARLAWISETYHAVIGSEGGSSYAAPVIHVAEGMFGPAFGWGDADLTSKTSKYYLGAYYPPDGPKVFMQQVPLKEKYEYLYYDPRFRLPLYETVFHDSVVTTSHWSRGSLKFANVLDTVALTELLYQVPPMYHVNLSEFKKHQERIKKHYSFFSPLHKELGFAQMTDFTWLTPDRMVQRTVFGGRVELVANFKQQAFKYEGTDIPPGSILARWIESGKTRVFTP